MSAALSPALLVMAGAGALAMLIGLPTLLAPARVRACLGLGASPEATYALRIAGTMLAALGLTFIAFAAAYAAAVI